MLSQNSVIIILFIFILSCVNCQVLLSNENCGNLTGKLNLEENYGWVAKVSVKPTSTQTEHKFCYANFITTQWLLGAGACISDRIPLSNYTIKYGANYKMEIGIDKVIKSPKFNPTLGAGYDLALIKMKRSVPFSDSNTGVRPICLADYDALNPTKIDINTNCYNINGAQIHLAEDKNCQDIFHTLYNPQLMFCGNQANCLPTPPSMSATNGAPIICEHNNRYYLAAMASWGRDCTNPKHTPDFDVYTKLFADSNYIIWINSTLHPNQNVPV